MQKAHIILLDPHGTILDYTADTECLAAVFNVLLQYGAELQKTTRQNTTPETPLVDEPDAPIAELVDNVHEPTHRVYEGTKDGYIEVEFDDKPAYEWRQDLRSAGFRWNRDTARWYGETRMAPNWVALSKPKRIAEMEARAHWAAPVNKPVTVEPVDLDTDIPSITAQGPRCKPVEPATPVRDLPAPGTVVRLTGGFDEPSIARGDSIADSTVDEADTTGDDDPFLASLNELFKRN